MKYLKCVCASTKILGAFVVAALFFGGATCARAGSYDLELRTHYQFGGAANDGINGSPDTGFGIFKNDSATFTFTGTVSAAGVANNGQVISITDAVTLIPGAQWVIGMGPESSNVGGWNGPFGTAQLGITLNFTGTVSDGVCSLAVAFTASDSEIHSGVPRTNPFGVTLDNYVLQGGDPFGRDTGDGYEVTQADGSLHQTGDVACGVPEPSSLCLLGIAGASLAGYGWRRRKVTA